MNNDTIQALNEFSGEQLLWLAIHSNASMKQRVGQVLEARAKLAQRSSFRKYHTKSKSSRVLIPSI